MVLHRRQRSVIVTGASGLLGRHVQHDPGLAAWNLMAPSSHALDVRHRDQVMHAIQGHKPDAVIHLAYNSADRRTTFEGSRNVAEAAAACGARLVHLSTDVVFGGRETSYVESDALSPATEYGQMKADAETAVMAACPGAVMIRTSLMYATDFLAPTQIAVQRALRGEMPISFFTDEFRCPAHAADIAAACAALAGMPEITGPLHVAGPEALSRADFAAVIARRLGLDPVSLSTTTLRESGLDRPGRVVLDSSLATSLGFRCRSVADALG
ncbi:unannotated protein [freshwater metagenome]|uniref:Unannotated protein n=1 Tax=freshwater metagenome TaxID=449393 RepID=A0A6J7DBC0_9ZZZZ